MKLSPLLCSNGVNRYQINDKRKNVFLIIFLSLGIIFLISTFARAEIPNYLIKYSKAFNIPIWYSSNFSFAESTHDPSKISEKNAFGRFQIRTNLLIHYCKITGFNHRKIKNKKYFLLNDKNNSYIFCYMVKFWIRQGYNLNDIVQIWLFGETGFQNGRYSLSFRNKIIKKDTKKEVKFLWFLTPEAKHVRPNYDDIPPSYLKPVIYLCRLIDRP